MNDLGAAVAAAFGIGVCRTFDEHQFTVSQTWRSTTDRGTFLVKRLWSGPDPFWAPELVERSNFQLRAREAGVATPDPVAPRDPAYGLAGRVGDHGVFRVDRWVDGRHACADDRIEAWAGRTAALLHGLQPADGAAGPRYYGTQPGEVWSTPALAGVAARVARAYEDAGDWVVTHGDFAPRNVLIGPDGPVLVDWDSVGEESASHELGDAAFRFGHGDPVRGASVVAAYIDAGGTPSAAGSDWVVRPIARRLADLAELMTARAGGDRSGWMGTYDLDARIAELTDGLPTYVAEVDAFAARLR